MEIRMDIIEHKLGGVAMLHLRGPLDSRSCQALAARAVLAMDDGPYALLLEVSELGYLTSEGFRTLLYVRHQATERQTKLALCGLVGLGLELLNISGLAGCFTLYSDQEDALAALQSSLSVGQFQPSSRTPV
jgi:anti-anti-sigma factor